MTAQHNPFTDYLMRGDAEKLPAEPMVVIPPREVPVGPWLTVRQAAARVQRGERTILAALADESLRGHRPGERGNWRIHVEDLDAWVRGELAEVQIYVPARPQNAVTR